MSRLARSVSIALALSLVLPPSLMAQQHVVEQAEIAARVQAAEAERTAHQRTIRRFLSGHVPAAQARRLQAALAALGDDDLRALAQRAEALEVDPVAGASRKTWIIVGAAVLLVVILAAAVVESCKEEGAECLE